MTVKVSPWWFLPSVSQRVHPKHPRLSFISSSSQDWWWWSCSAGGPSDPAGISASGAARRGPRCEQQKSTNPRPRWVLGLTEALCVGQGEFDGGGQLSDHIRIEHEMRKDVAVRHEVRVHVHIPLCGEGAAAAAPSPGQTEQPAEQRPPEQDVDPGVQDGIHGRYPDGSQISSVVICQLEVVGKHLYLKREIEIKEPKRNTYKIRIQ